MNVDPDMPPLVDASGAGFVGGGGGGFIPPPPGAHFEGGGGYNPFPGAPQAHWAPPATAPVWQMQGQVSPSPWATTAQQYPRYESWSPYPYSPYHLTPAGEYSPALRGIPTPGGGAGAQGAGLGQPITSSPYFNAGAANGNLYAGWPDNAGPERRRKQSFGPGPGRDWLEPASLERTHSQDSPHPHTPGFEFGFGGGFPLMRSLSTGAVKRARSQRQPRRVGINFGRHFYPEEYGSENLARRPRDWRPDYEARRTFMPRIPRPRSDVVEYKDPIKRAIHPTLFYNSSNPCVRYDLRSLPHLDTLEFPHLGRPYNHIDFAQLAMNPPFEYMRLFHPLLPWYIEVEQRQDNGITVEDVFMQMFFMLQLQITARDYFNEELRSGIRERIATAFAIRTHGSEEERGKGIKRVDYLEEKVIFVGLDRTRNGLWEMKTVAPSSV